MKNNTKLIMETWRKFLNEGPIMDNPYIESESEPDEGFHKDGYAEAGYDPDAFEEPSTVSGETSQGIGDTTLDLIRQGTPEHLIQAQAKIEGLLPEEVEDLRVQFAKENKAAFYERNDDSEVYDPNNPEVYVPDDSEDSAF